MSNNGRKWQALKDTLLALLFLYIFLVGIKLLGGSLKGFGKGFAEALIRTTSNPFVGLFIGIIATATIQSSSATTSIVVGFVAAGALSVRNAIPIIMGANIGTTVTNILVSLSHLTRTREFERAFPAAVVHDIFNLLSVLVFFPLEYYLHIIDRIANMLAMAFKNVGGVKFTSPLKLIVAPVAHRIMDAMHHHYLISFLLSIVMVIFALVYLVKILRRASAGKFEILIDRYLFATPFSAWFVGFALTAFVQSSSVTTSLVVPLAGAGILSVEKIFPYVLGANVGTTLTAILASFVTGSIHSIHAAFCHLIFNLLGICVWYPLRKVPITVAKKLGDVAGRKKWLALLYILVIFFIIPGIFILTGRR